MLFNVLCVCVCVHSCRWADLSEFVFANVYAYMKWTEVGN